MDPITQIEAVRAEHWRDGQIAPARGAFIGLLFGAGVWMSIAACWKLLF